ncbi:DUF2470 domain-containing protein [Macrococcus caseolyticus]|nr:DUF2470 domain-containing protein [Macrococcus caseolyticus]RKO10921.1 DUF2470 domain-containing protein [Macrococcus caseolyticus]
MSGDTAEAIISHMNKDHRVSLYDYLANYANIKLSLDNPLHSVELVDVKLDKLTLNYSDSGTLKSVVIPIQPPLKNLAESRFRFVSMAHKSADAIGKSPYRITKFVPPESALKAIIFFFTCVFVSVVSAAKLTTYLEERVTAISPQLYALLQKAFYPVMAIHLTEYFLIVVRLLRFHRAPLRLYIIYLIATIAAGFSSWPPLKRKATALAAQRAEFERKLKPATK